VIEITVTSAWLFQDGVWYIHSMDRQRPCVMPVESDSQEGGVLCFVSEEVADKYLDELGPVIRKQRFVIRHVRFEELRGWAEQMQQYGPWLLWWQFETGGGGKHQGVKINDLLMQLNLLGEP
jgi:hypothetical protein